MSLVVNNFFVLTKFNQTKLMETKQRFRKTIIISVVLIGVSMIIGLIFFTPTITAKTVFETLAFDKKMNTEQDFTKGQFNGLKLEERAGGVEMSSLNGKNGEYISSVVEAPFKATHIGLHWEEELTNGALINIYLRTSTDGENFSEWVKTTAERDMGRDGFIAKETFAALVGTEKAEFAQAKIEFILGKGISPKLKALTFTFLNSEDESETVKKLSFVPRSDAYGIGTAKASPNGQGINVISREDWDANESYRNAGDGSEEWPRSYHGTRKLVIHHTADTASNDMTTLETNKATVRSIYYYHAVIQGWGDIGYNALVDADGNIYEGRYGTHGETHTRTNPSANQIMELDVDAGHVSSYNSGSFGVSAMGNFTSLDVPEAQLTAIKKVLAFVADSRGIDASGNSDFRRYDGAWHYDLNNIMTHRDVGQTACPGDKLYSEVEKIKTDIANLMLPTLDNFFATSNLVTGNIGGDNVGSSTVSFEWSSFSGATQYQYALEEMVGIVGVANTSEPWEVAWLNSENPNMATTSNTSVSFGPDALEEGHYVFYVRALNSNDTPISSVSHVNFIKDENNIIIDNLTSRYTNFVGDWYHSINVSNFYAQDYQPNAAGNGNDIFEWSPNLFKDGYYDVFVMYSAGPDRDRRAPYMVFYQNENNEQLQKTITVDQKTDGGVWISLGNYYFERGDAPKVQLSDNVRRGYVIADAVKFAFDRPAGNPVNQPPVADAGANKNVLVNTEVLFDGSGSTDDNNLIVKYEWEFGDGKTGAGISPINIYNTIDEYTVTLTVTDNKGLVDSDTITITVANEIIDLKMTVASIDMGLKNRGVFTSATALIKIVDANNNNAPVSGATVSGSWSGLTIDNDSAITDSQGQLTITSDFVKNASGAYTFNVDSVTKDGWIYNPTIEKGSIETE